MEKPCRIKASISFGRLCRNDRYVFNISGNKFRLVTIVVFFQGFLHIRFVGTHAEYDKIKDIKNI
ncbi:type II toxin-antitoxin system HigB family toxin [Segatella copri]|uniref:Type II toxin-antitoxin system HigB family toxin n=1 Tax=Segatella copri TaxID=165179 RepID=A0AAW5TUI1_9BACT|nr:type II toxin-antitoxin system HigB family toxin [Segatella copri]MCW4092142.1 type II toxin-antitoxin system HigB family toxin [Segatella copri]